MALDTDAAGHQSTHRTATAGRSDSKSIACRSVEIRDIAHSPRDHIRAGPPLPTARSPHVKAQRVRRSFGDVLPCAALLGWPTGALCWPVAKTEALPTHAPVTAARVYFFEPTARSLTPSVVSTACISGMSRCDLQYSSTLSAIRPGA